MPICTRTRVAVDTAALVLQLYLICNSLVFHQAVNAKFALPESSGLHLGDFHTYPSATLLLSLKTFGLHKIPAKPSPITKSHFSLHTLWCFKAQQINAGLQNLFYQSDQPDIACLTILVLFF